MLCDEIAHSFVIFILCVIIAICVNCLGYGKNLLFNRAGFIKLKAHRKRNERHLGPSFRRAREQTDRKNQQTDKKV